jgi:hypothetical protein
MHLRGSSAALFFIVLVLLMVLILTGCGGGGDQSGNNGSQGGEQGEAAQDKAPQGNAPQAKVALGTIKSVKPDRSKIILRPSTGVQGGERMIFKVRDDAEIELNDEPAEMADVKEGQQAQIQYVVNDGKNRARVVSVISSGEGTGG